MREELTSRRRSELFRSLLRLAVALAVALTLLLAACGSGAVPAPDARMAVDDGAVHQQIVDGRGEVEVTFDATVVTEPVQVGGHEHLNVKTPAGDILEVDHNTSLASAVPAHAGDRLIVHGKLYIDSGRAGVHCTHRHTSRGCPQPGWIELAGSYFE